MEWFSSDFDFAQLVNIIVIGSIVMFWSNFLVARLENRLEKHIKRMEENIKKHSEQVSNQTSNHSRRVSKQIADQSSRSDRLYEMFIDLLKERKRQG